MKISKITIKQLFGIKEWQGDGKNIELVGDNGTGKTSVIDAIRYALTNSSGKNDNFDALMAMMALKHIMDDTKDIEIHPFTCEVTVTPTSISCSSSGNKAFLEDIDGGMEWAEETSNLIKDIMSEQTIKLTDLMKKKFGFDTVKVKPDSEDGFADFLKNLFGGGVQTIANKINNLPAIAFSW